jgi:hypothetical protein
LPNFFHSKSRLPLKINLCHFLLKLRKSKRSPPQFLSQRSRSKTAIK